MYTDLKSAYDIGKLMDEIPQLPIKIEADEIYLVKLRESLGDYQSAVKKFNKHNKSINIKRINYICKKVIESIEDALNGNLIKSLKKIDSIFKFKEIEKNLNILELKNEEGNIGIHLYRARVEKNLENIQNVYDMFHMPLNLNWRIGTNRYSASGCPYLYLASSVHGAYTELDNPAYNEFFISRYSLKKSLYILDFIMPIADIERDIIFNECDERLLAKYIYTYPIICASSFIVNNGGDRTFKSEYIFSQLLLQVIKEDTKLNLDGIRYSSVKQSYNYKKNQYPFPLYTNYVIISKSSLHKKIGNNNYFNDLLDTFKLTKPFNCKEERKLFEKKIIPKKFLCSFRENRNIYLDNINISRYSETIFYRIEKILYDKKEIDL
ncbi:MAG: hypothetical protein ACRCWG_17660 [Sarcina sp.]